MYRRILCVRCGSRKLCKVRRGKKRCQRCGYEFTPWIVRGLRLERKDWRKIIDWFLLERSGLWIAQRLSLGKNQTYRALRKIREVIVKDVPEIFEDIVEKEYTKGKNHINGLEGFWGYLKRKPASKGGVKREHLCLFLGEYVWRFNHQH